MNTALLFIAEQQIDPWVKIAYTAFVLTLIPFYWKHWGPENFLWFSDIALFLGVPALWFESQLLAGIMAVGVLLPELYWNIELVIRLLTGFKLAGLTDYMWDKSKPLYLRLLSLFHVILPAAIVLMLEKYGYDTQAIYYQTILAFGVLWLCYKFTPPEKNINWAFGPGNKPQKKLPSAVYLILLMLAYVVLVFVPTHLLLKVFF